MRSSKRLLSLSILFLAGIATFGQAPSDKPAKARRVFTNEDLGKLREKYGVEDSPAPAAEAGSAAGTSKQPVKTGAPDKAETPESKAYWAAKLKEKESALAAAKAQEQRFQVTLAKYEEKLRGAQGSFHIETSQMQVEDSQKNLARAKDQVKQAEEAKAKLLAEASEKGLKPSDLREAPEAPGPQK
ncbi:MAG TPA: hypothetical protein VFS12_16335 [Terriglobia bacterium]|nr:hypothetical protein [Terriglobia bacterium]